MKIRYIIIAILLSAVDAFAQDTAINPKEFGAIGDGASHKVTSADITAHSARGTGKFWIGTYAIGDGTHAQSVQGNIWKDCHWDGNFVCDPDFAMCRHGTNSQGSENLFLNCHFNNPKHTAFYNYTYNALQQTFIGGNFSQHCLGIALNAGSVNVFSVGFQAAKPKQIDQGGEDLHISNSADAHSSIMNCRSESFKFLATYNQHYVTAINNNLDSAAPNGQWLPNHAYTVR